MWLTIILMFAAHIAGIVFRPKYEKMIRRMLES